WVPSPTSRSVGHSAVGFPRRRRSDDDNDNNWLGSAHGDGDVVKYTPEYRPVFVFIKRRTYIAMSTPARRRLMRDFKRPEGTPFEDGTFKLTVEFTEEYPNKPPTVRFVSKMFHPNVYADGSICLDILQNRWSPTYDVSSILTSIQSLLDEPNPNSPANSQAAQLYQENKREYEKRVSAIVEQSWRDS
ncbi:hypothetical protein CRUP_012083, partial [Coryphaenoides rupestris]